MSSSNLTRVRRVTGPLAGSALCALALGACRADSVTMPDAQPDPICYSDACDPTDAPALGSAIVIQPVEDIARRIVPTIADPRAREEAGAVVDALRRELAAGRADAARMRLAYVYDWVAGAGDLLNAAELSAIRLALVPASSALGVRTR